jgi:DNA (cytosine-5)-methyltransferase 1
LKGGSSIGIPSPPAMWRPGTGSITTPDLRDAERLQGFPTDWTAVADEPDQRKTQRWKLVGNAVSVPVARWVGERLNTDERYDNSRDRQLGEGERWPHAAWGRPGTRRATDVSMWPVAHAREHLHDFLGFKPHLLSVRATEGFLRRAMRSTLRIPEDLICEAHAHLESMRPPLQRVA